MNATMLRVEHLSKEFSSTKRGQKVRAVDDVSFEVQEGQFLTLLGPSGCGKTTTLRCIAGLERPQGGQITVADRVLWSAERGVFVQPNDRAIGMVFQSYAIWPHMNVFENVAFPLRVSKARIGRAELTERVERALAVVELDHLAGRYATQMSGGQQQRLALARALVIRPTLLLLDEPLSNLDAKLRESLRFELKRLQREWGITTVYVTHDQAEALSLSNVVAVMRHGSISQFGKPTDVYEHPATRFVADFVGTTNFLDGVLDGTGPSGLPVVRTAVGDLEVRRAEGVAVGQPCSVSVRPEHLLLDDHADGSGRSPGGTRNSWEGVVRTRLFMGEYMDYELAVGGDVVLRCRTPADRRWSTGKPVSVTIPAEHCVALPVEDVATAV
jgi:iron(III) transport system ATP-binding protein